MPSSPSFDLDPPASTLGEDASPLVVCRYHDGPDRDDNRFEILANVACDHIQYTEGPHPPVAQFHYLLDVIAEANGFPTQFEHLWCPGATAPAAVVRPDERIVVLSWTPHGERRVLFDGFAQVPQVDLGPDDQVVSFTAVGIAARCFDQPVIGRLMRPADDYDAAEPVSVDLPCRFNPDGRPNCTPAGHDVNQSDPAKRYPVFTDEQLTRSPDPRTAWTLSGAIRYLLALNTEQYVRNPDFGDLDALLKVRSPKPGAGMIDPADPSTYDAADITVRDYDASNKPWPDAVAELAGYAGFGFAFVTRTDDAGHPVTFADLYRVDNGESTAAKVLWLDKAGSMIDPARNTVSQLHLARDLNAVVNSFSLETALRRVECSIVLAPGFIPAAGDETAANRQAFKAANLRLASAEVRDKYRLYVADEAGEGHWDGSWVTTALDLSAVFKPKDDGTPSYVKRVRPGSHTLLSADSKGTPYRACLHFSRDYAGPTPAVWDGSGHWQPIDGGWRLLTDRLGILVTCEDPEAWPIGEYTGPDPQEHSKILRGITSQANPSGANTRFVLCLTTVIDDDLAVPAYAPARVASPTKFPRIRRVDARDHFQLHTVAAHSFFNQTNEDIVVRDDTDKALAHARQLRATHEMPPLAGSVTLPFLTNAYEVGDRISVIRGREASLRGNAANDQGEGPAYPRVVAVAWHFAGEQQSTVLQLSDLRARHSG
jgi:hypothetical protein